MNASSLKSSEEILKAVGTLPSLPKAVTGLMRMIEDENSTASMLAKQIEADAGLLGSILRLANSPRYMARGGIATASEAVVVLGFDAIRNLVCVAGVADYFRKNGGDGSFDHERFLRHSAGVACAAKLLAAHVGQDSETAFAAGILHDIGQLALAAAAPDEFRMVLDYQRQKDCLIVEAEHAVIGVDHTQIGVHLADQWNLPAEICEAIEYHHQSPGSCAIHSPIADLAHVAEVLAHALELGTADQVPPLSDGAMLRLGLSLAQVAPLLDEIEAEYSDYAHMLGL